LLFLIEILIIFLQLIKTFMFQKMKQFKIFFRIFKSLKLNLKMNKNNMKMLFLIYIILMINIKLLINKIIKIL